MSFEAAKYDLKRNKLKYFLLFLIKTTLNLRKDKDFMNYELKIDGAKEPDGKVDLRRLAIISDSICNIVEGALQIRLKGLSFVKGKKKIAINEALTINLTNIREGSIILDLEAKPFEETLEGIQLEMFNQEYQKELLSYTPVSLFINTYQEALNDNSSSDNIDKSLLRNMNKLKKAFFSDEEVMFISNQNTIPTLKINKESLDKIKIKEEQLPDPERTIIYGKLELMQHSNYRVKIITEDGIVDGFLNANIDFDEAKKYLGEDITITGNKHFKPNSKVIIEIDKIFSPEVGDDFFSKIRTGETVEQQIERQLKQKKYKNPLKEIIGKWPGDEDFDELINMLTK